MLTYFALVFAISWGGVLLVIGGPSGIPGAMAETDPLFPFVVLAMLAGPSAAGVLLTGLFHGKVGLRAFRSRLLRWRVDAGGYAVALLSAPLLATAVLLALTLVSPEFLPSILVADNKAALLLLGFGVGLGAGFFEELGWTGFAVPELRRRYGVLATGLIVGVLWSAWHVLVVVWGIGNRAGAVPLPLFVLLDGLTILPAFRVLMVWVYERTGSLLVGMLMHAGLSASTIILWPRTTGAPLLTFDFAIAAAMWAAIAVIAVAHGRRLSRQPLRAPVA